MEEAKEDDEPFEGARTMALTITLGTLMMTWPLHELMLFRLFRQLCKCPQEQARAIWFSLVSLEIRLRIMNQLAELLPDEELKAETLRLVGVTRKLSENRNKHTHWMWTTDGRDWSLVGLKRKDRPAIPVSDTAVKKLTTDITRANDSLAKLMMRFEGTSIRSED